MQAFAIMALIALAGFATPGLAGRCERVELDAAPAVFDGVVIEVSPVDERWDRVVIRTGVFFKGDVVPTVTLFADRGSLGANAKLGDVRTFFPTRRGPRVSERQATPGDESSWLWEGCGSGWLVSELSARLELHYRSSMRLARDRTHLSRRALALQPPDGAHAVTSRADIIAAMGTPGFVRVLHVDGEALLEMWWSDGPDCPPIVAVELLIARGPGAEMDVPGLCGVGFGRTKPSGDGWRSCADAARAPKECRATGP